MEGGSPQPGPTKRSGILGAPWLPWVAIVVATAVGVAVALLFTLGSSTTTVSPTPTTKAPVVGVAGQYMTASPQDSRLLYADLKTSGDTVSGRVVVTTAGPARKHLVSRRYEVTGTVKGETLDLSVSPAIGGAASLTANVTGSGITFTTGGGATVTLEHGSLAAYDQLVERYRSALLS